VYFNFFFLYECGRISPAANAAMRQVFVEWHLGFDELGFPGCARFSFFRSFLYRCFACTFGLTGCVFFFFLFLKKFGPFFLGFFLLLPEFFFNPAVFFGVDEFSKWRLTHIEGNCCYFNRMKRKGRKQKKRRRKILRFYL